MANKSEVVEKRLRTTLELNTGNFAKDFKNVNALLKDNQTEVKNTSKELKAFGENTKTLTGSLDALTRQYELQSSKADIYRTGIEKTTRAYESNIEKRKELSSALGQANQKYEEAVLLHGKESEAASEAAKEVSKLQKEYDKTSKNLDTNEKSLKRYNTGLRNTETELKITKKAIDNTSTSLEKSNNKWLQSAKAVEEYKKKVEGIYNQVNSVGNALIKGGTLIATGVAGGLKVYGEFGDSLAKVNSIAKLSADDINGLGQEIKQLSNDMVIPINVLAEAEYQALSASVEVGKSMEFLADASKLAKGGFTDVVKSVDVLTTVLNAYSMQTQESARVSDILIATQNAGKVTVGEMADKLGELIPTAKNAYVNIENVGASIATLTSQGIKPAQSITYLNSLFNEFSKSGTTVSKVLQDEAGKSFAQLASEGKSVSDILLIIQKYSNKTGTSFNDLFGSVEAAKGAMGLLSEEGTKYTNVLNDIKNSAGATQEAFEGISNTDMEQARKSMNELVNSFIKLGSASAPILSEVSGAISDLADKIESMDDETLAMIAQTGKWFLILGAGTKGVAGLLNVGKGAISTYGKLATVIGSNGGVVGSVKALTTGTVSLLSKINPLTAVVTILGGGALLAWSKATQVQEEKQAILNKALQETQDILKNGIDVSQIDSYTLEIDGLDKQISDLKEYEENIKSARREKDELLKKQASIQDEMWTNASKSTKEYSNELIEVNAQIEALDIEIAGFTNSMIKLDSDIKKQYGSVEVAKNKLEVYKQALEDAKEEKILISKITDDTVRAFNDEANALAQSARSIQMLGLEYDELTSKKSLNEDETKRLKAIEEELIRTVGDSIAKRDDEGRIIGINIDLLRDEVVAQNNIVTAKKQSVKAYVAGGKDVVAAQKEQTQKVIELLKQEQAALLATERKSLNSMQATFDMLDFNSNLFKGETEGYNPMKTNPYKNQVELERINKEIAKGESTLKELDGLLAKVSETSTTVGQGVTDIATAGTSNASGATSSMKNALEEAMDAFERRKKLGQVTLDNEMYELEVIKNKYAKTTDEKISMDEYMLRNYLDVIERKKAAGQLYFDKEIQMMEIARDKYAKIEADKVEISNQINEMKLDNARKWIDEEKYYNRMSLEEEKAAYDRMLGYAQNNADEVKAIKREIYRVEKEILAQEVQAVKDATDEKIKEREREKKAQLALIDEKLKRELDGYQAELDALDRLEEEERRREREQEHTKKISNLQDKLTGATTDSERNAIIEEMNAENESYAKYLRDQQRKDEREAIRQKMEAAREKAQVEKDLAEKNYESFVEGLTEQQNAYINFLEGKGTQTATTEQSITNYLAGEYANRNLLFQSMVDGDIAYLRNAATVMQGIYSGIASVFGGIGLTGKLQMPSIPSTSGKTINTSSSVSYSPTIYNTYTVGSMATAKAITADQENMLNKQARNLGVKR